MTYGRTGRVFEYAVSFGVVLLASTVAVGCGDDEPSSVPDEGDGGGMMTDDAGGTMTGDAGSDGDDASMSESDGGSMSAIQCITTNCAQYISAMSAAQTAGGASSDGGMNCLGEVCGPNECASFFTGMDVGGDAGTSGGGDAGTAVSQCVENQPEPGFDGTMFTEACGKCACNCNADAFTNCGAACWGLIKCARDCGLSGMDAP